MNGLERSAVLLCALLAGSCGAGLAQMRGGGGIGGGGGLSADCRGDFGEGVAAAKLEGFLQAANTFAVTADEIQSTLLTTCVDMGHQLGLSDADMAASGDTPPVRAACEAVAAKIHAEVTDVKAAHLTVTLVVTPPVCEVHVDAYAECAGHCDASYTPGSAELHCEGGELRGGCSGECSGHCSVEAHGSCSGSCEGTCSASCTGVCHGACDGRCATTGADGQCNGRCTGTCQGTCSAGCTGSCEGHCVADAHASCQGECRGECSVHFTEPRCTGHVTPPQVSAECQASCNAQINAQAECTPGHTELVVGGNVGELADRVNRLKGAIEVGIANILALKYKLELLRDSAQAMIDTAQSLPDAVRELGLGAAACVTAAAGALPRASASVSVSIEVSASVSGSAG